MPLPTYISCMENGKTIENKQSRDKLIVNYFNQGFTNAEILSFLKIQHEVKISNSTLKRSLKKLGLRRKLIGENEDEIKEAIKLELEGSSGVLGKLNFIDVSRCITVISSNLCFFNISL